MRRSSLFSLVGLSVGLGVCIAGSAIPETAHSDPLPAISATDAFVEGDCHRCHTVPEVPAAPRLDSCEGCHVWIRSVSASPSKREKAMSIFPHWERYERNIASYLEVPSLEVAMARLEPEWVRGYLADPHDLRPNLPETMPRFGLSEQAIDAIVTAFEARQRPVAPTPTPLAANVERGRELFTARACGSCHTFGSHASGAVPLAPDLAHARARMSNDAIVAWIQDPQAVSPAATMPNFGLTRDEAIAIRDFLVLEDPRGRVPRALGPLPAPTSAPVTWAEVEERVFGKICVHCHMNPELNQGRAGPGNDGGFGWAATGIELQTYEGVRAVADRIPAALERRRHEAARDDVSAGELPVRLDRPERPGMPLGLPPLSDEDTALVLGWIAQGMPR